LIVVGAPGGGEDDFVILTDLSEGSEERIAMACNHHIPRSTGERCGWDVPHRLFENAITVTFQHHDGYADPGYFYPSNQGARGECANGRH
jgi:hypothetical protein